jgi:hypothetical protein
MSYALLIRVTKRPTDLSAGYGAFHTPLTLLRKPFCVAKSRDFRSNCSRSWAEKWSRRAAANLERAWIYWEAHQHNPLNPEKPETMGYVRKDQGWWVWWYWMAGGGGWMAAWGRRSVYRRLLILSANHCFSSLANNKTRWNSTLVMLQCRTMSSTPPSLSQQLAPWERVVKRGSTTIYERIYWGYQGLETSFIFHKMSWAAGYWAAGLGTHCRQAYHTFLWGQPEIEIDGR